LYSLGFVSREKVLDKVSKGRPKYVYRVNKEGALKRILENIEMCSNVAKSVFERILTMKPESM
jgi:predicted transcriptional regulator